MAIVLATAAPAAGVTLAFDCISNNLAADCAIGEAQMTVDVTDPGEGLISFRFENAGPAASSITGLYWDDDALLAMLWIANTPGLVEFSSPAIPASLPGANEASPAFAVTANLSADADPPGDCYAGPRDGGRRRRAPARPNPRCRRCRRRGAGPRAQ